MSSCGSWSIDGLADATKYALDDITTPTRCKLYVHVALMTHHHLVAATRLGQPPMNAVPHMDGVLLNPCYAMYLVDMMQT